MAGGKCAVLNNSELGVQGGAGASILGSGMGLGALKFPSFGGGQACLPGWLRWRPLSIATGRANFFTYFLSTGAQRAAQETA